MQKTRKNKLTDAQRFFRDVLSLFVDSPLRYLRIYFFFYFGPFLVPTQITDVSCILVRFQKDQKLASSSGLRGTPILVALTRRQLVQVVSSGSLSTRTGGCHCRGGGQGGLPPRTRASRTSPSALAPWASGSVFEADVFNPLIELLEHGIIIRFLVIKDKLS